jgi:eukaryotic-like serine/threonine-protein kinase
MPIPAGTRIGAYEVIESLGAGGMGEVYRARDSRLDRDVAIKILPEAFAHDADRLARFEREAKTLAALNHPHIAAIYGVEEGGGVRGLVLELVDGPTLAGRIAQGAIPIDEALPIALQIIDALEAAHETGIIHRDLKPANIKVRPDGTVKVLDFGLAKLASDTTGATSILGALSLSPTISTPAMTGIGFILGTAAYMAPEQARGRAVDKRVDIWAFGCVLFEMLTGRRPFDGEDVTETVGAVIHKEPAWNLLSPETPPALLLTLQRCLEKNPKRRIRDIGDARLALSGAFQLPAAAAVQSAIAKGPLWRRAVPVAIGAIVCVIAGAVAAVTILRNLPTLSPSPKRLTIQLPGSDQLPLTAGSLLGMSRDGTMMTYRAVRAGASRLYLRRMNQLDAQAIGDAAANGSSFFSPDGAWIGYGVGNVLKKVPVVGGPSQTIGNFPTNPRGATWGTDNQIIVGARQSGLMRISAAGGTPMQITKPMPGRDYWYPQLLSGGRAVLFTAATTQAPDSGDIAILDLQSGEERILIAGVDGHVLSTGHLVFVRGGSLWAVPFDINRLEVRGTPVPVVEGIRVETGGAVQYVVGDDGTLAYVPGVVGAGAASRLVWVDRTGREEPIKAPDRNYGYPRLSPDGTRLAIDVREDQNDLWVWEFARGTLTRLTFDRGGDTYPRWTGDGKRVVYSSAASDGETNAPATFVPFTQPADGTGNRERLATFRAHLDQSALSPDGKWLVMRTVSSGTQEDIMLVSLDNDRQVQPLIHTPFRERNAEISPDGRWIAYQSNESGADQVYVRPFPAVDGGKWQVSAAGGGKPLWARNGREIFYVASDNALMTVPVQPAATFTFGNATRLLDTTGYSNTGLQGRSFDVTPDGRRFLFTKNVEQQTSGAVNVVLNWFTELKQKVPVN